MTIPTSGRAALPQSSDDPCFDDIRPCRDAEVGAELQKVFADRAVINSIQHFRYPWWPRRFTFLAAPFIRRYLRREAAGIRNVADFQLRVSAFMDRVRETTTDGVTFVGFDRLPPEGGYLFISNHRDISLDPAFIDKALFSAGRETVRIAIGDNLLRMSAATALMRLNKSFIVRRSVSSPREKLRELSKLSAYIGLSVREGHSVWIAQREGRAKDGDDRTEEAVLKMLGLYGRSRKQSFAQYMSALRIVPVAITYEYDPNDLAKAQELYARSQHHDEYHKDKLEDINTITRGIRGYKGRVTVVAGDVIAGGFEDAAGLARIIDDFIWRHYRLYPPSLLSAGADASSVTAADRQKFSQRLATYPEHLRPWVRAMYARPYLNAQQAGAVTAEPGAPDGGDAGRPQS